MRGQSNVRCSASRRASPSQALNCPRLDPVRSASPCAQPASTSPTTSLSPASTRSSPLFRSRRGSKLRERSSSSGQGSTTSNSGNARRRGDSARRLLCDRSRYRCRSCRSASRRDRLHHRGLHARCLRHRPLRFVTSRTAACGRNPARHPSPTDIPRGFARRTSARNFAERKPRRRNCKSRS